MCPGYIPWIFAAAFIRLFICCINLCSCRWENSWEISEGNKKCQPFDNHIFFWLLVFCVASVKLHKKISEENLLNFEKRKNICRL